MIAWQDPNFGVRFNDTMEAIASVGGEGRFQFLAESSLSIRTREHLVMMKKHHFRALLPGVESWYDMGNKSNASHVGAREKVSRVSEHVNMVLDHVPYIQTNFVLGLDCDSGEEPFELTKEFIDKSPGAFPGYSLLTSFGEAAPINLQYQREGRVLPLPFHFLNNHLGMNLKPKNYEWIDFYERVIDLTEYTFSTKAIYNRFKATSNGTSRWMNVMRAVSNEGFGRIRFYRKILKNLREDRSFRAYFEGESTQLPAFYKGVIERDLGSWLSWLPAGAIEHNQNAYLNKTRSAPEKVKAGKAITNTVTG
jgi:hypothetical protein